MDSNTMAQAIRNDPQVAAKAQQQLTEVLTRSATDPEFRQLLLSDSRAALSQHLGRELPESYKVVFVENRADATVVLPDPIDPNAELSDAELEAVAGGLVWYVALAIGFGLAALGDALT